MYNPKTTLNYWNRIWHIVKVVYPNIRYFWILFTFFFKGRLSSSCTIFLQAATIIFQITIKIVSKYLDYKEKHGQEDQSSTYINKVASINSKYIISLGSALFLSIVMISSIASRNATRHTRIYYLLPLNITTGCVLFPLLIIWGNTKLKKEFVEILIRPRSIFTKYFSSNMIYPIV